MFKGSYMKNFLKFLYMRKKVETKVVDIPKMYLILREDLAYKYIQGGHALAQFALEFNEEFKDWHNRHLICLSVFNGQSLKDVANKIKEYNLGFYVYKSIEFNYHLHFSTFVEPDLESGLPTAICFYDPDGRFKHLTKDLKLATK